MRRRHEMPFGVELGADGTARFRLWAPAASKVDVCLGHLRRPLPMTALDGGWYELACAEAGAGSRYIFRIDERIYVPDPASRAQPDGVHGTSVVVDPAAWSWRDDTWAGRPWHDAVIYELHVGTFTPHGSFAGVMARLDYLAQLGVTAIELMPVAEFPGARNWGYDGALPFAPAARYGRPEELKALVQAAHLRGLMVFLDVVYNHFGPEGNYLHEYAPQFFSTHHRTPWGAAINFDGTHSRVVRDFFIHNALYWLDEYHFDGLRLDAVHAIADDSQPDFLVELAQAVYDGARGERHIHLVLENDRNESRFLSADAAARPRLYAAQWNDDLHHALHVLLTGERDGYYADYADAPLRRLGQALAEGFAYQGEPSAYRGGTPRGEASAHLPPTAFIGFLQNHDQVGNRALGERLTHLATPQAIVAATAILLLAPSPPLLFMGQEWGAEEPFPFFCDFEAGLASEVREGRRNEFARFPEFADAVARARIPDPNAAETFACALIDWEAPDGLDGGRWLALHRELLALRAREIVPRLARTRGGQAQYGLVGEHALVVRWRLDGAELELRANLDDAQADLGTRPRGRLLWATPGAATPLADGIAPAWSAAWYLAADSAPADVAAACLAQPVET